MNAIAQKLVNVLDKALGQPVQNTATPPRVVVEGPQGRPMSGYRGATQSGTLDGLSRSTPLPLTPADEAELRPKLIPRPPPHYLAGVPYPSPAQFRAFDTRLAEEGFRPSNGAQEKLKELDAPWLRLGEAIAASAGAQRPAQIAHIESLARRVAEGDTTVHKEDAWSLEDWREDAQLRISAFKTEQRKIADQAWAIAEPALLEKADFADEIADTLEVQERNRFELMSTAFYPCAWLLAFRKYAESFRDGSRRNAGLPSAMLDTL